MTHVRQVWRDAVREACILLVMLWHGALVMEWLGLPVPAGLTAFNNAFAQVPVVGMILGGGQYGGLFAVNFRVSGSASQPGPVPAAATCPR